jgi:rod shape-determining protein MreD
LFFSDYIKFALFFVVLIFVQVTLLNLIAISRYNITPDLVLLLVIYLGISRGHIAGMISGFLAGLLLDILSGSFTGLAALSYTVSGFVAGYFHREPGDSSIKFSFVGIIFMCAVICYFIYFSIYFQGAGLSIPEIILKYVLTTAAYTTVFGFMSNLIFNKFDLKKSI